MFSDVDPLDSSVSPITSAAIGPTAGQYYRGAVVVALSLYAGISLVSLCGGMLLLQLRVRSRNLSAATSYRLAPHLGTLHFPSVGLLIVGLFGQGLATCGMSLIRLGDSVWDIALGVVSLLVCAILVVLAGVVTTAWLQVRKVKQKPIARGHGWAGIFLSYSTWRSHWQDTSGGLQFKKRYMMLIDDMQLPWWTAVEMSSSFVQGCILGLRINSTSACRGQLWVLTTHCLVAFGAAVYFRPCGAVLSNFFLVLSKLGALIISSLLLLHALTLDEEFGQAAEVMTSVSTAIATVQVVAQIMTAVLLAVSASAATSSAWSRLLYRAFRKLKVADRESHAQTCYDEPEPTSEVLLSVVADKERAVEQLDRENRALMLAGQFAGAMCRRLVMQKLIRAADPSTPREERLYRLIEAAIAQRSLPDDVWLQMTS